VGVPILGAKEVRIVVADQRQIQLARELDQVRIDSVLLRRIVRLQFDEESRLAAFIRLERLCVPLRFSTASSQCFSLLVCT
jgi:hypothetical protein